MIQVLGSLKRLVHKKEPFGDAHATGLRQEIIREQNFPTSLQKPRERKQVFMQLVKILRLKLVVVERMVANVGVLRRQLVEVAGVGASVGMLRLTLLDVLRQV